MPEPYRQFKIILNPISGAGRGLQKGTALARLLHQAGIGAEVFITQKAQDAEKEAKRTHIPLIVVGGDGTVNEVINGLAGRKIPLAIFPTGTANILAREFHLPRKPAAFLSLIESGKTRLLDVGQLHAASVPIPGQAQYDSAFPQQVQHRFLMLASIGLDAEITRIMRQIRTGSIHFHSYLMPLWYTLKNYHFRPFTLLIDDRVVVTQVTTAVIGNMRNYGGFFSITHKARPDDGLLDICTFPGKTSQDYVRYLTGAILHRPSVFRDVAYYRGKKVEVIQTPGPIPVELDGDFFGYAPFACTLIPQSVPVLLPA
ncbi:MAG: diacylglycerol kinase family protein [bacterium]